MPRLASYAALAVMTVAWAAVMAVPALKYAQP